MTVGEVIACALSLCLGGMWLLSQAMDRHCSQLFPRGEPGRMGRCLLRFFAVSFMALSLGWCVWWWGGSVGAVAWMGWLSMAALLVAWSLAYAPRSGAAVAALAVVASLAWTIFRGVAAYG